MHPSRIRMSLLSSGGGKTSPTTKKSSTKDNPETIC